MSYAYGSIVEHLSKAEPSADLREALLNTCYVTSLIKFEPALQISHFLGQFLSFLESSVGYALSYSDHHFADVLSVEIHRYARPLSSPP